MRFVQHFTRVAAIVGATSAFHCLWWCIRCCLNIFNINCVGVRFAKVKKRSIAEKIANFECFQLSSAINQVETGDSVVGFLFNDRYKVASMLTTLKTKAYIEFSTSATFFRSHTHTHLFRFVECTIRPSFFLISLF